MNIKSALLTILAAIILCVPALAAVPPIINYQGKLMQPSGAAVPDGTYTVQFAIYDAPTGGAALWSETNNAVQVKGGLFSVLLGSVNNLGPNIFDQPNRFFGVRVGSDPEMTPRQQIASVAFAVKAGSADVATTVPDSAITTSKVADGAITAAKLAAGVAIPPGTILMWSGAANEIPTGWALCDGTNGTPNLRDRFIVGAGAEYAVGDWGGLKEVTLTVGQMPSHNHTPPGTYETLYCVADASNYQFDVPNSGSRLGGKYALERGGDQPHENRPPYYALCFIVKLGY